MLNKQSGNMYDWVTHTFNIVSGKCSHGCEYCYMKHFTWGKEPHLIEKEFKTDLGEGNSIFVGSGIDMWAWTIPDEWIERVLEHCRKYPKNTYLFQSKNPWRFTKFYGKYPEKIIFGTTIESNREYPEIYHYAPPIMERVLGMEQVAEDSGGQVMVTLEPILDFDVDELVGMIKQIQPLWVNIGADSKGHKMPEPSKEKLLRLIDELKKFTEIKQKHNLNRLLK